MLGSIIVIYIGACLGAFSRWGLAGAFNAVLPNSLGTLIAMMIGIGVVKVLS